MKQTVFLNFLNYMKHWLSFDKNRSLRKKIIEIKKKKNSFYDYGENFFYQDMPCIKLPGLRNTKKRIDTLNLNNYLKSKTFLDIGSNIGSIILNLKNDFMKAVGIEYNPKLIEISKFIAKEKNLKNCEFIAADFLKFKFKIKFNAILSLANHSTFDKGINNTDLYFKKIDELLLNEGLLVLESHSPLYEPPESFKNIVKIYCHKYRLINSGKYDFGNFYDRNREFFIFQK